MARTTAVNYGNPGFQYATVDGDQFDRTDVAGVGQSVETHDHSNGYGLAVTRIANGTVGTAALADGSVTTVKLGDGQVTSLKIADGTIATGDLADGAVTQAKLANLSVGTAQLVDANVTTVKIADANVTQAKLATASVGTAQLVDGSVTSAKLGSSLSLSGSVVVATGGSPLTLGAASSGAWISPAISGDLQFAVTGTSRWQIDFTSGSLLATTDNTYDIGASGANRPRNLYLSGSVGVFTKAGAPVDADFTNPVSGMLAVDTTNSRLFVRVGTTWKFAALT